MEDHMESKTRLLYLDTSDLRDIRNSTEQQDELRSFLDRHCARLLFSVVHLEEWAQPGVERMDDDARWWSEHFPRGVIAPGMNAVVAHYFDLVMAPTGIFPLSCSEIGPLQDSAGWQRWTGPIEDHSWLVLLHTMMDAVGRELGDAVFGDVHTDAAQQRAPERVYRALARHGIPEDGKIPSALLKDGLMAWTRTKKRHHPAWETLTSAIENPPAPPDAGGLALASNFLGFDVAHANRWNELTRAAFSNVAEFFAAFYAPQWFWNRWQEQQEVPRTFFARNPRWIHLPVGIAQQLRAMRRKDKERPLELSDYFDDRHLQYASLADWATADKRTLENLSRCIPAAHEAGIYYHTHFVQCREGCRELLQNE
jgi:hypothetical protein